MLVVSHLCEQQLESLVQEPSVCDTAGAVIAYLATGTARDAGAASRVALSTLAGIAGSR